MSSAESSLPLHVTMPPVLRTAAARRPEGNGREAILRLADELETAGSLASVSRRTMKDALRAYAEVPPATTEVDPTPPDLKLVPVLRRAAARRPEGNGREAILRLAEELEAAGSAALVSRRIVQDALKAYGEEPGATTQVAPAPPDRELVPVLRRAAARRPEGNGREAILRLADELEAAGSAALVPRRTIQDALKAYGEEDLQSDGG